MYSLTSGSSGGSSIHFHFKHSVVKQEGGSSVVLFLTPLTANREYTSPVFLATLNTAAGEFFVMSSQFFRSLPILFAVTILGYFSTASDEYYLDLQHPLH